VPVDEAGPTEVIALRDLARRLEALGDRLAGDGFPSDLADRAEGIAHLAEQLVCWLGWAVGYADPRSPAFHRQNDLVTPWGGPNADNVYRHARVDPSLRYRIRGRMHACSDFILAVRAGFMHMPTWGTLAAVTASDLGIGPGEDFELLVGGSQGAVPLPAGAIVASIREYYFDWSPEEPATFTIECLDHDGSPPPRVTGDAMAGRLEDAISAVEHSVIYWNDYMCDARAAQAPNTFATGFQLAKGLEAARYAFCFWDLADGEALVVESNVPDARYWSFQLYTMAWFELVEPTGRITSLNHRQVALSADGRLRVVVSARDPGLPNWLDTGGRPVGLLTLRWFWPRADPTPLTRVVPVDEVRSALPADTPRVSAAARRDELARRREHLAWRFRT